jgi:HD superfamily phosphohydrolase
MNSCLGFEWVIMMLGGFVAIIIFLCIAWSDCEHTKRQLLKKPLSDDPEYKRIASMYDTYDQKWKVSMEQWKKDFGHEAEHREVVAAITKRKQAENKFRIARAQHQTKEFNRQYDELTRKPDTYYEFVGTSKIMTITKEFAHLTHQEFSEKFPAVWQVMKAKAFEMIMEEATQHPNKEALQLVGPYVNLRDPVDGFINVD